MNKESSKPATPEQQTASDRSPLRVPDVTEHQYHAQDAETNRPVRLVPIQVPPGERAPVNLPYGGRTAPQYLADCLSGEAAWYPDRDWNRTVKVITIYHGIWANYRQQRRVLLAQAPTMARRFTAISTPSQHG